MVYNHKDEKAKLSQTERWLIIIEVYNQYRQASKELPIDCAGIGCERKRRLIHTFRCWFCGRYFCPQCAREHFGDRS